MASFECKIGSSKTWIGSFKIELEFLGEIWNWQNKKCDHKH
jgi:hypothetical protein